MGTMKSLIADIQQDLWEDQLSREEIALKYDVPRAWVDEAAGQLYDDMTGYDEPSFDHFERDHDEPYEPDYAEEIPDPDSWYEAQYDLGDY